MIVLRASIQGAGKLFAFAALVLLLSQCQTTRPLTDAATPIKPDARWDTVDQFRQKGLPASALPYVEDILKDARTKGDLDDQYRALVYLSDLLTETSDPGLETAIRRAEEERSKTSGTIRALAEAHTALLYRNYLNENRWRILERGAAAGSGVAAPSQPLAGWTLLDFVTRIDVGYAAALSDAESLKERSLSNFPLGLSNKQAAADRDLRPTLFDLVAHHALEFYSSAESGLTRPRESFQTNQPELFAPPEQFAAFALRSPDSLDYRFKALMLYQELTRFHRSRGDGYLQKAALLQLDLDRLAYARSISALPDSQDRYLQALLKLQTNTCAGKQTPQPTQPEDSIILRHSDGGCAAVAHALASAYREQADAETPFASDATPLSQYRLKAEQFAQQALTQYPESFGAKRCAVLLQQLREPLLQMEVESALLPNREALFLVSYRNVGNAHFRVVRMTDALRKTWQEALNDSVRTALLIAQTPVSYWTLALPAYENRNQHSAEIALPPLALGQYMLLASPDAAFDQRQSGVAATELTATQMAYLSTPMEQGGVEGFVLDRETGTPLADVTVETYLRRYDYATRKSVVEKNGTQQSDARGAFTLPAGPEQRQLGLALVRGEDRFQVENAVYLYRDFSSNNTLNTSSFLFSDRSLYRPGQPVYVKGILIRNRGALPAEALANAVTTVYFRDANGEAISSQVVRTNDFGSYTAVFTAPPSGLSGSMTIQDDFNAINVQVEQYKRPRFEVQLEGPEGELRLGDSLAIRGTALAYTGASLVGAQVTYRVYREAYWPWWYVGSFGGGDFKSSFGGGGRSRPGFGGGGASREIAQGTAMVRTDGSFDLSFLADIRDLPKQPTEHATQYMFRIHAEVTDPSGETRSADRNVLLGHAAFRLDLGQTPGVWDRPWNPGALPAITVSARNAADEKVRTTLTARLVALDPPKNRMRERLWAEPDQFILSETDYAQRFPHDRYSNRDLPQNRKSTRVLWEQTLKLGEETLTFPPNPSWPEGEYALLIIGEDNRGQAVATEQYLRIKRPQGNAPFDQYVWLEGLPAQTEPGQRLRFRAGSPNRDDAVLVELRRGKTSLLREWVLPGTGLKTFEYTIQEADRGGLEVEVIAVRDNRQHQIITNVAVPWTNRTLSITLETFRDRMEPGSEQSWTLSIKRPSDKDQSEKGTSAELLLSMYDASLDALLAHQWNPWSFPENPRWRNWSGNNFWLNSSQATPLLPAVGMLQEPQREYDGLYLGNYVSRYYRPYGPGMARGEVLMAGDALGKSSMDQAISEQESTAPEAQTATKTQQVPPPLRSDFRETAFFFPQLKTDENGSVSIRFLAPESLTRWRIMGLAHDTELRLGLLNDTTITRKDLMVTPNFPRYLREGDKLVLSARIDNMSATSLQGEALLLLFDTETGKALDERFGHKSVPLGWTAAAGQNAVVSWLISVPRGIASVRYELRAQTERHRDGEAAALPILPRRVMVSESFPLTATRAGLSKFRWDALADRANKSENQALTLEFTPNPAWYAVQALPYLMEFPQACTEQTFSRYYANSIGTWIAQSDPAIAAVFERWKGTAALNSNLEKNEDLKALVLEETPWLREARDETQRKQRLGLLLDANHMRYESSAALNQLLQAQSPNGGWPWFPGGQDHPYITRHIVAGLGHLDALGVQDIRQDSRVWNSVQQAIAYMDARAMERWTKSNENEGFRSDHNDLHYFYARSFFADQPIPATLQKEFSKQVRETALNWNERSVYEQVLLALALHRLQAYANATEAAPATDLPSPEISGQILASLKERAQRSEELGMWWPELRAGFYWYEAPTETQALLIEAFDLIDADIDAVEAMKVWLLRQKQTNAWSSTRATAEACYAILSTGKKLLGNADDTRITVGKTDVQNTDAEAGTGYIRQDWDATSINASLAEVEIEKTEAGLAWGALHWRYLEDLDKVVAAGGPLSIQKTLYRQVPGERGPELLPITADVPLELGETLVTRLVLTTDRDLEFVHLKDGRASGLEPIDVLSGYRWNAGLGYYTAVADASTNFFLDYLPRGTWVFEYESRGFQAGSFSAGPATVQCLYAPEFQANSSGQTLIIRAKSSGR